jgi:hypothetical protein
LQVDSTLYTNFIISGGPPASCSISGTFGSFGTTGYVITVIASTQTDPVIDFGLNFSGQSDPLVSLKISTPYVGGPYSTIYTTSSGTLTDTGLNGTASALPAGSNPTDIQTVIVNGSMVPTASPQNPGCTASGPPGFSQPCGPPTGMQNPAIFATSSTGTLELDDVFLLSAGASYAISGSVNFTPEPATGVLLGGGLLAIAAFARRRRQSQTATGLSRSSNV